MEGDDAVGGTGEWVALLGFSQGAKLAASLLLMLQRRAAKGESFRFGVLMAGRAPLIALEPGVVAWPPGSGEEWKDGGGGGDGGGAATPLLRVPTIHVHGMRDPGLEMHVELLRLCCERGSARLVEWDGEHRLPIKTKDVLPVVEQILAVAKETGVLV
ncbi:hypothetical protein QBC33DRAFT_543125 [Phialemonium atrogriseum]|uniref:Serine hydrolase domain-containing protein n=1 Tax=Phialemonium atrogriseum TaxID=1093897 RepID=A0AAJ0FMC2_9PEZI|nr:uncharacterized protein QBC33DRAFT_543125 [Phialemonium atrogriseum]KAK1765990.1 hypothetical protein QBC33DRAFT_543125 [Phialemonium atrogriseum]